MKFEKWQALGNDYVIVEAAALPFELTDAKVRRICDPHFGVGSDGVLLLTPVPEPEYVAELRIFNPDGSEAELSGNGAREAVLYLRAAGWTRPGRVLRDHEGRPGYTHHHRAGGGLDGDRPGSGRGEGTLESGGREWSYRAVNVGNPQCVVAAGDVVEDLDLGGIGPGIEGNTELFPESHERLVHASRRLDGPRAHLRARGGGDTLVRHRCLGCSAGRVPRRSAVARLTVRLDGGELTVEITDDLDITLIGTAEPILRGELSQELVRALESL